jgi:hypothetical protein
MEIAVSKVHRVLLKEGIDHLQNISVCLPLTEITDVLDWYYQLFLKP